MLFRSRLRAVLDHEQVVLAGQGHDPGHIGRPAAVVDALRGAGYLVEHAGDGEEALEKVRAQTFDGVVCDLRMPRLDGRAFHKMLAASSTGLAKRVIFVTGDVAGTDAEEFLEQSGCRWLAKPFRLADLLRTLKEVLT